MAKDSKEKKHFWKDFKAELRKVIWPTPKQLVNNTVAVITIVIIVALIVFVLDFAFGRLNSGINSGIKSIVDSKTTNTVEEDSEDAELTNAEVDDNEDVDEEDSVDTTNSVEE